MDGFILFLHATCEKGNCLLLQCSDSAITHLHIQCVALCWTSRIYKYKDWTQYFRTPFYCHHVKKDGEESAHLKESDIHLQFYSIAEC